MVDWKCPECNESNEANAEEGGTVGCCQHCGAESLIPLSEGQARLQELLVAAERLRSDLSLLLSKGKANSWEICGIFNGIISSVRDIPREAFPKGTKLHDPPIWPILRRRLSGVAWLDELQVHERSDDDEEDDNDDEPTDVGAMVILTGQLIARLQSMLPRPTARLNSQGASRHIPQKVKDAVWRRDDGKCVQCGSKEKLEFDHIIPHSKGGHHTARNVQLLCEKCNRAKSDKIG